jgi:hypothetical protein
MIDQKVRVRSRDHVNSDPRVSSLLMHRRLYIVDLISLVQDHNVTFQICAPRIGDVVDFEATISQGNGCLVIVQEQCSIVQCNMGAPAPLF